MVATSESGRAPGAGGFPGVSGVALARITASSPSAPRRRSMASPTRSATTAPARQPSAAATARS